MPHKYHYERWLLLFLSCLAPISCETIGVIAIRNPVKLALTGDQSELPIATPASAVLE